MPKPDADPHSLTTGPENTQSMESLFHENMSSETKKGYVDEMN